MQTWVDTDSRGRQYVVRTGTGVVTAVAPVGIVGPDDEHTTCRVEIYCDAPHGRPGAIRYSVHPVVSATSPLCAVAYDALDQVWPVVWTVEWHRHDWIPDDLPVGALNLVTDTRSILKGLDRVLLPEPAFEDIPDFAEVQWRSESS
jgi:hypothetical protein